MDDGTRVCGYCLTRQPLAELATSSSGRQCLDTDACQARAAAALLYGANEADLEQHSAAPRPIRLPDPARDDVIARTLAAEAAADAGRPVPAEVLEIA